jgi:WS/DGAT/MGAT family acyltransferase
MPALVAVKEAAGVSLNDVFLAVCGGGVRRYLSRTGTVPSRSLTASVPMATRTGSHRLLGNHVDNLFLSLRTDLADPVERVRAIHAGSRAARRIREALGPELFEERAEVVPPVLHSVVAASLGATGLAGRIRPPLNLVASCVRGPRVPLEVDGGVVTALFSSGPILEGIGLNLTAWTYVDAMSVSVLGCSASLPDPSRLAEDLGAELVDWTARL